MKYRKDKYGNEVSVLGYGCMRFTSKGMKLDYQKAEKEIMEAYNFMEIVIVDEALEVARFLLDNNDGFFQDYSFDALQKETSDTELKKVVNLMASMNR